MAWVTGVQFKVVSYKNLNIELDTFLVNTLHYKVRFKDKWSNQEREVDPSRTP